MSHDEKEREKQQHVVTGEDKLGKLVSGEVRTHNLGGAVIVADGTKETCWLPKALSPTLPKPGQRIVYRMLEHREVVVVAHGEWHYESRDKQRQRASFESNTAREEGLRMPGVVISLMQNAEKDVIASFICIGDLGYPVMVHRDDLSRPPPVKGSWWSCVLAHHYGKGKYRWSADEASMQPLSVPPTRPNGDSTIPGWTTERPAPAGGLARKPFHGGVPIYPQQQQQQQPQYYNAPPPPPVEQPKPPVVPAASKGDPAEERFEKLCSLLAVDGKSREALKAAEIYEASTLSLCTEEDLLVSGVRELDARMLLTAVRMSSPTEEEEDLDQLLPSFALDSITFELIVDPVVATDGHTYDRSSIEAWFRAGHRTSPLTNEPLPSPALVPNRAFGDRVRDWIASAIAKEKQVKEEAEEEALEQAQLAQEQEMLKQRQREQQEEEERHRVSLNDRLQQSQQQEQQRQQREQEQSRLHSLQQEQQRQQQLEADDVIAQMAERLRIAAERAASDRAERSADTDSFGLRMAAAGENISMRAPPDNFGLRMAALREGPSSPPGLLPQTSYIEPDFLAAERVEEERRLARLAEESALDAQLMGSLSEAERREQAERLEFFSQQQQYRPDDDAMLQMMTQPPTMVTHHYQPPVQQQQQQQQQQSNTAHVMTLNEMVARYSLDDRVTNRCRSLNEADLARLVETLAERAEFIDSRKCKNPSSFVENVITNLFSPPGSETDIMAFVRLENLDFTATKMLKAASHRALREVFAIPRAKLASTRNKSAFICSVLRSLAKADS